MDSRIGFGKRVLSLLIDNVLTIGISLAIAYISSSSIYELLRSSADTGTEGGDELMSTMGSYMGGLATAILSMLVLITLVFLLEGFTGYSPGKLILGYRIKKKSGEKASPSNLLLRSIIKSSGPLVLIAGAIAEIGIVWKVGILIVLILFIGCFFALGDQKRSLHDQLSGTAVFKR